MTPRDPSTEIVLSPATELQPAPLFAPTPKAAKRVLEFFTAQINNDHTRKAYLNATRRFAEWCDGRSIGQLADVQAFHVAAFVKELQGQLSPPTVKQHLAALRMLFDWLVTGHIIDVNPAHAVRGPKYVVKKGKTPVLTADEARELLDSIKIVKQTADAEGAETDEPALVGLRDRALIGVMVYAFARVGAVIQMKVRDYFVQGRRGWVRLHEKGGKEHEVPCHHNLEQLLDEYIEAAGIAVVAWFGYMAVPYEFAYEAGSPIYFRSVVRAVRVTFQDIKSVDARRWNRGFVTLRHTGGSINLLRHMPGIDELIAEIHRLNPSAVVRGSM
jgi:site-specific recombinase XerD